MLFTQFLVELGDTVTKAPFSKQTYHTIPIQCSSSFSQS